MSMRPREFKSPQIMAGLAPAEDRICGSRKKLKTRNDRRPINPGKSTGRKIPAEGPVMKPATPETELPPSTQLREAVFGSALMKTKMVLAPLRVFSALALAAFAPGCAENIKEVALPATLPR